MVQVEHGLVHGQARRRAGKGETGQLADGASPAVTPNQPGAACMVRPGRGDPADLDAIGPLLDARDLAPAPYLNIERGRPLTQDHLQALLDTVNAALLVLTADGRVAAANRAARLLLRGEGPRLSDVKAIGTAAEAISHLPLGSAAVVRPASGQQMLASASHFAGGGESQRLVSLQAVVGELDAVQIKAWEDMTRVLAHEIMNSLTPIASLSESLSGMIRREGASRDTVEAIDTIARRSQGLVGFVARYRLMAELPEPR